MLSGMCCLKVRPRQNSQAGVLEFLFWLPNNFAVPYSSATAHLIETHGSQILWKQSTVKRRNALETVKELYAGLYIRESDN